MISSREHANSDCVPVKVVLKTMSGRRLEILHCSRLKKCATQNGAGRSQNLILYPEGEKNTTPKFALVKKCGKGQVGGWRYHHISFSWLTPGDADNSRGWGWGEECCHGKLTKSHTRGYGHPQVHVQEVPAGGGGGAQQKRLGGSDRPRGQASTGCGEITPSPPLSPVQQKS